MVSLNQILELLIREVADTETELKEIENKLLDADDKTPRFARLCEQRDWRIAELRKLRAERAMLCEKLGAKTEGVESAAAAAAAKWQEVESLPNPSAMADHRTWQRVQRESKAPYFLCSRPGGSHAAALPVGLLDSTLDEVVEVFAKAMAGEDDPLSQVDCRVAFKMCEEMANGFDCEMRRASVFNSILGSYLGKPINPHRPIPLSSGAVTDGSVCCVVYSGSTLLDVPVYIQEVKVEIGTSGDPYFQGQRYYQLYLTNSEFAAVIRRSVLPALFVELVGPHLRVSALASPEEVCVVCEPLTPFLHLFNMLSSQPNHMCRVARVLRALKRSITLLQDAYGRLSITPALSAQAGASLPVRDPSLQLPYPLRSGSGFHDVKPLMRGSRNPLYVAKHEQSHRRLVVKFAFLSEQATQVHRAWAAAGLAPELVDARLLPCGLAMLVMEYLSPEDGWTMFHSLAQELKLRLSDAVLVKLQEAHAVDVGGSKAVHADMRQANVMVKLRQDGQQLEVPAQVRFLDFDWSGLVGQTRLPPFISQRLRGYGAGQEVTQEYDVARWRHELEHGDVIMLSDDTVISQ